MIIISKEIEKEIIEILPLKLRKLFSNLNINYNNLLEIRLRVNKPLIIDYGNKEYFISNKGEMINLIEKAYMISKNEIKELLQYISNYSIYAYEKEIRQGFITIKGGHRIGVAGKVIRENEYVKSLSHVVYTNIRIAHEIKGCSDKIIDKIYNKNTGSIYNTLIISPPCCGKTTLLRDIIRNISNGYYFKGINVGLIDERSEIAACYKGIAQNDIGIRTDVLDCCTKVEGINMLLRSMSPKVIAVDEIGGKKDLEALRYCVNSGCDLIATVHGLDVENIKERNVVIKEIIENKIFDRYIVLDKKKKIGNITKIINKEGDIIE